MNAGASSRSVLMIEAVAAARLGQKGLARRLFNEIIEKEPHFEQALLWLAALADTPDESIRALEQVLVINPTNQQAISALAVQKMHQTARPTEVLLPPPPASRALPAAPFQSVARIRAISSKDGAPVHVSGSAGSAAAESVAQAPRPQFERAIRKVFPCPLCNHGHSESSDRCGHCGGMLKLGDLWQIAENRGADEELLARAIERWSGRLSIEPYEANLNIARALLSLNRSGEALPYLERACGLRDAPDLEKFTAALRARKLIIAVDDSQTIRKLVAVNLERRGYRVLTVEDGMQALARFEEYTPDLLLLDISLPKVDGYEVCRIIRKHKLLKNTPVVMLSGRDGFFDRMKGKLAGASDYLTKPFDLPALLRVLEKHLGRIPA